VIARAGMSRSVARWTSFLILLKPSRMEYSVWTWRCAKDIGNTVKGLSELATPYYKREYTDLISGGRENGDIYLKNFKLEGFNFSLMRKKPCGLIVHEM
jgi:hypothetical protein